MNIHNKGFWYGKGIATVHRQGLHVQSPCSMEQRKPERRPGRACPVSVALFQFTYAEEAGHQKSGWGRMWLGFAELRSQVKGKLEGVGKTLHK